MSIYEPLQNLRKGQVIIQDITKTSPCNEGPLTPDFYLVKLGFKGVYIFSYFYSQRGGSNVYPQSMF